MKEPVIVSADHAAAENIKVAVINKDLEELATEALPMILYFLDDVVAVVVLETDRPLVPFSTCEAFNPNLHTGLLGRRK